METYWVLSLHDGPVERSPPASPQARPPAPSFFSVYFFFRRPPLSPRPSSAFFSGARPLVPLKRAPLFFRLSFLSAAAFQRLCIFGHFEPFLSPPLALGGLGSRSQRLTHALVWVFRSRFPLARDDTNERRPRPPARPPARSPVFDSRPSFLLNPP